MVDWIQKSALFAHTHASGALAWERTYSPSICLRIVDMPQPNPARCHVLPPFVTWHLLALSRSRQSCLHSSCRISRCSATMLAQHLPNQQVYGNHACTDRSKSARCLQSCTTPAESAGESQPCVALHLLNHQVFGNHACTTPAEPSGVGDELYGLLDAFPSAITAHHQHLLIQQVLCKHDSHKPSDSAGIVQEWLPYT